MILDPINNIGIKGKSVKKAANPILLIKEKICPIIHNGNKMLKHPPYPFFFFIFHMITC